MFDQIIIVLFLLVLGYLVFYLVEFLKACIKILKDFEVIAKNLRREQEFVDSVLFHTKSAVENIEDSVYVIENIIKFSKGIKDFWQKKQVTHAGENQE